MALVNIHFLNLQNNYLFADIAKRVNAFKVTHPKADIVSLGIGDVTQPLCPAFEDDNWFRPSLDPQLGTFV